MLQQDKRIATSKLEYFTYIYIYIYLYRSLFCRKCKDETDFFDQCTKKSKKCNLCGNVCFNFKKCNNCDTVLICLKCYDKSQIKVE
jgi:hypothetical protein